MANLNKVFLIGNLTRDPELRYVPSGTAVASFGLATNRTYTAASGEKKQEVCFVRIVVWGRTAEICGEYLSKGSPAFIEGRLQYRAWDSQNGEKRSTLEVRAERVQFLGRKEKTGEAQAGQGIPEEVENINLDSEIAEPNMDTGSKTNKRKDEVPF
ncbi:MAG: single-stranded DNA-binding protein [Candidatus Omnitrophica bacterium]|nr:single-stranded DNA-binding protein [Candidatus Omnitrophota bacterium]MBU4488232.1 single-stranded DNA-binding protein [Candidatus Omnitrophota bacterium]MCG2704680.1 single-stranded DNA-binding protein [Candidatus Omnitrophota bacterium]